MSERAARPLLHACSRLRVRLRRFLLLRLADERAVLELADRLVGAPDDLLAFLEAGDDLEVLVTGDADGHGTEGDLVVRADHEHAFDVALADLAGRPLPAKRNRGIRIRQRRILTDRERDDRDRQGPGPYIRDDLRRRREVGARLFGGIEELD